MAKKWPRYKSGKNKGKFMKRRDVMRMRADRKKKRNPKRKSKKRRSAAKKGRRTVAKKKRRRRGRSRGYMSTEEKAKVSAAGVGLGWAETNGHFGQVPIIKNMGSGSKAYAVIAFAAHYGAKQFKSRWLDRASVAAASIAGYKFGEAGFALTGDGDVGWDDAMSPEEVAGDLDLE